MDAYLLYSALEDSPMLPHDASVEANGNFSAVAKEGRKPGLTLNREGKPVALTQWANELFDAIAPVAATLDTLHGHTEHTDALTALRPRIADASLTPSARVLQTMRDNGQSFDAFALGLSREHAKNFLARPLSADEEREMKALAAKSVEDQAAVEHADTESFDAFVASYRDYHNG
jgi:glutamate--cysteine ligase